MALFKPAPRLPFATALAAFAAIAAFAASPPVHLLPHFAKGQSLRYRIETETTITGQTTTPIANPEGASRFQQTVNLVVRLDVLDAAGANAPVRLRATYEQSDSRSGGNGFDPQAQSLDAQYKRLRGHSIEFSIAPDGTLSDFNGLEDIFPNRSAADSILSWARAISSGRGFPRSGIRIGQRWRGNSPVPGGPLEGLVWQTDSRYLRDEPCEPAANAPGESAPADSGANACAVILTEVDLVRHGSGGDATPEEYRHNGLRTSGRWTGAAESLDSIALSTGFLVHSTQTGSQDMDYRIVSAISGSAIHRVGHVQSQTEIALLPSTAPPAPLNKNAPAGRE